MCLVGVTCVPVASAAATVRAGLFFPSLYIPSSGKGLCPAHSKFSVIILAESSRWNITVGETDVGKNNRPQIILLTL